MFLLRFSHEGKKYFLYRESAFCGGHSKEDAEFELKYHTAKSIAIGGFEIVEVKDLEHLKEFVSEYPFKIINFSGGLGVPFEGVLLR